MPCSAGTAAMLGECSSRWWLTSPLAPQEGTRQPAEPVGPLMLGMGQDRDWEHGFAGEWSGNPNCISLEGVSVQAP